MQRLFETEGATFTEYVLAQRLARAHRMLSDPSRDGEKISTVAYDCGFERASEADAKLKRLYDAIENGIADLSDPMLNDRVDELKAIRDQARSSAPLQALQGVNYFTSKGSQLVYCVV